MNNQVNTIDKKKSNKDQNKESPRILDIKTQEDWIILRELILAESTLNELEEFKGVGKVCRDHLDSAKFIALARFSESFEKSLKDMNIIAPTIFNGNKEMVKTNKLEQN
ncbi:MAG: hypothetical protein K9M80_05255 [Candidatus Marinimicrobia bacterium]|nr:hypothetical protein [Candidatus Neomarinimicrobiota bacterium]